MPDHASGVPEIDNDSIICRLWRGEARTLHEAEEQYLNASLGEAIRMLQTSLSDEELGQHPLFVMYRRHGSRGWEDSLL